MKRTIAALLGVLVTVGVWTQPTAQTDPTQIAPVRTTEPNYQVCLVRNDRATTPALGIGATTITPLQVSLAAGGEFARFRQAGIGSAGGTVIRSIGSNLVDFGVFVFEAHTDNFYPEVVLAGERGLAAHDCSGRAATLSGTGGWSTLAGERVWLVLSNPFSSEAVVAVTSASDIGLDSANELSEILIPPYTTITRELERILPTRISLSLTLTTIRGAAYGMLMQSGEGDFATEVFTEPALDWWLTIPATEQLNTNLTITSLAPSDGEFRVELYSGGDLYDWTEGVLAASEQVDLDLVGLELPLGARVTSSVPTVVSGRVDGVGIRAVSTGLNTATDRWLVPGVGVDFPGVLWVLNPGPLAVEVVHFPLKPEAVSQANTVPAQSVLAIPVSSGSSGGYLVESVGEIVPMWTTGAGPLAWGRAVPADRLVP